MYDRVLLLALIYRQPAHPASVFQSCVQSLSLLSFLEIIQVLIDLQILSVVKIYLCGQ